MNTLVNHPSVSILDTQRQPHSKRIQKTYQNNLDSDYTERLYELGQNFEYASNSCVYWSNPELSVLYGTPLYQQSSAAQKLALNHLYWVIAYGFTAASEANAVIYNQVTNGVFQKIQGYEVLCQELEYETVQEDYHIRTFQRVGYKTQTDLVGKTVFKGFPGKERSNRASRAKHSQGNGFFLRAAAKLIFKDHKQFYSDYLRKLERDGKSIPVPMEGVVGRGSWKELLRFFSLSWGSSPFMACQYYSMRFVGNALLKNQEAVHIKYYRELERQGKKIPAPTAISHYHLLDEAFHTTMSQTLAKNVYRDFAKPSIYEHWLAGLSVYLMQKNLLGGLSAVFPGRYISDDLDFMFYMYQLLISPLFGIAEAEALAWIERCFCQEHEGFHVNLRLHQRLLDLLLYVFRDLDYQWPVNRDLKLMVAGGNIEKAIRKNAETFRQFSLAFA